MDAQAPVKDLSRERDRAAFHGVPRTRRTSRPACRVRKVHLVKVLGTRRHANRRVHGGNWGNQCDTPQNNKNDLVHLFFL